jgi:hypothetical protein
MKVEFATRSLYAWFTNVLVYYIQGADLGLFGERAWYTNILVYHIRLRGNAHADVAAMANMAGKDAFATSNMARKHMCLTGIHGREKRFFRWLINVVLCLSASMFCQATTQIYIYTPTHPPTLPPTHPPTHKHRYCVRGATMFCQASTQISW